MATAKDIQIAVDDLATKLGNSVLIEDEKQFPIWWSTKGEVDPIRQATILYRNVEPAVANVINQFKVREASAPIRTPEITELGMWPRIVMPIKVSNDIVGYVWVLDPNKTIGDSDLRLIIELADLASYELGKSNSEEIKLQKLRGNLIERLLQQPDEKASSELAQLEKISIHSQIQVQAFDNLVGWRLPNGYSVQVCGAVEKHATSGAGLPLVQLAEAYRRARLTHQALKAGAVLSINSWDELGPWRLIVEAPVDLRPVDIHSGVEVLLDSANADLLETARAILDTGGEISSIAKKLFIHRTTLYYRMDRILELTGVDLRDASSRTQLQLALWLDAFRKSET